MTSAALDELARDLERVEAVRAIKDLERAHAQRRQMEAPRGSLATELIDQPLITLSPDGESARGRWLTIAFLGDGAGGTRIEGGIYENTYRREASGWRIAERGYHRQFDGDHASGWTNVGGEDLPIVPFHFTADEAGVPIPPPPGSAPPRALSLAAVEQRIAALVDEDDVRNLLHVLGYYLDRRMWDDAADLFGDDGVLEFGGRRSTAGRASVRELLESTGPAGLREGQLEDRPLFDTIVRIRPGGEEALARTISLGMLADRGTAAWEFGVVGARFAKAAGRWRISEARFSVLMRADYRSGWGHGGVLAPPPAVPGLLGDRDHAVVDPREPGRAPESDGARIAAARRRLARAQAYDGVENVSAAYGFYLDDFQWPQLGALFAREGNKQSPFAGYYLGQERIIGSVTANWGAPPQTRPGISYHWRTQPVIHVSSDGRSAHLRVRLFQPRTGKEPSRPGTFYAAGFHGGMYPNDQAVLEDGVWRLWSLTIDEPYFTSTDWHGGWATVVPSNDAPRPSPLLERYPPDIPMTALGRREEHFRGGTGDLIEWPGILPMWFHYRNPVSGRMPERYWPDCVPSGVRPESSMTAHGYQMPPNGPHVDGVEIGGDADPAQSG